MILTPTAQTVAYRVLVLVTLHKVLRRVTLSHPCPSCTRCLVAAWRRATPARLATTSPCSATGSQTYTWQYHKHHPIQTQQSSHQTRKFLHRKKRLSRHSKSLNRVLLHR